MAHGHTMPLLDLSKALCCRGLTVTIITTPLNVPDITSKVSKHPQISLRVLPFPRVPDLPEGCENTAHLPSPDLIFPFFRATKMLQQPFEGVLREMFENGCLPICVISDFFLEWTLDSCRLFGIPRFASHGMGVLPMAVLKAMHMQGLSSIMAISNSDHVKFPQLNLPFAFVKGDVPDTIQKGDDEDPWNRFITEVDKADVSSAGLIVNSFEELEGEYLATLESFLENKANAWCVGPLLLVNNRVETGGIDLKNQSCPYIDWLDKQPVQNAVIYVSFGTQFHVSDAQMDEIAMGLEMAGQPFVWVVRSTKWSPPEGWEERVNERGLVARDWVDQRSILAHPSTGGFLTHCGWNSVLESLSSGVPLLAWPMGAEQGLNAKYVVEGMGAGILIPQERKRMETKEIKVIGHDVICDGVKELMAGERGRRARERARELGVMARQAVEKGGSSDRKLDELIESLTGRDKKGV
ncbi:probable UDP-glucosyl transferase 73B6 [Rhododendron vialii]|uniref:probable UDP-glucosyl transferase 73B6 n=1 Tax=Rhododendron vialii TaxID=182163 RepID=UPI00265DBA95|nr:probable UDP-glucosyl transferase 73B6 [Rhododendron vialii]